MNELVYRRQALPMEFTAFDIIGQRIIFSLYFTILALDYLAFGLRLYSTNS